MGHFFCPGFGISVLILLEPLGAFAKAVWILDYMLPFVSVQLF